MDRVAVSKYLSYLLRHDPGGLDMDRWGFVPVEQLLAKLRERFPGMDRRCLKQVVESSDKQRFEFRGTDIRARYGHSVSVELELPVADDVEVLYHGTNQKAAWSILRQGLQPHGRQMVHLSATKEEARQVGRRHGPPVVLRIDAAAARRQGITIYQATEKVYLAEYVPAWCISRVE